MHARELPTLSVEIREPWKKKLELLDGTTVEIIVFTTAHDEGGHLPIRQRTLLSLTLPKPVDYETIVRYSSAIDIMFGFLIGVRLETAIYHFPTTMTRTWNKKEQIVEVESWIAPSWKRITEIPDLHDRMFVAENTPICLERILQACLTPKNIDLVYFMDMILVAETYAKSIDDCFGELLGLLEDFDKSWFGRGIHAQISETKEQIGQLVNEQGDDAAKALWKRINAFFKVIIRWEIGYSA